MEVKYFKINNTHTKLYESYGYGGEKKLSKKKCSVIKKGGWKKI